MPNKETKSAGSVGKKMPLKGTPRSIPSLKEKASNSLELHNDQRA